MKEFTSLAIVKQLIPEMLEDLPIIKMEIEDTPMSYYRRNNDMVVIYVVLSSSAATLKTLQPSDHS